MTERRRHDDPKPKPAARPSIDAELLARAADINEAVAGEFAETAFSPLENPLIERMAELGIETEAAVSVALQRAHRIAFYMRQGRPPREEISSDARATLGGRSRARRRACGCLVGWRVDCAARPRARPSGPYVVAVQGESGRGPASSSARGPVLLSPRSGSRALFSGRWARVARAAAWAGC